jgi:hypothetical protein
MAAREATVARQEQEVLAVRREQRRRRERAVFCMRVASQGITLPLELFSTRGRPVRLLRSVVREVLREFVGFQALVETEERSLVVLVARVSLAALAALAAQVSRGDLLVQILQRDLFIQAMLLRQWSWREELVQQAARAEMVVTAALVDLQEMAVRVRSVWSVESVESVVRSRAEG